MQADRTIQDMQPHGGAGDRFLALDRDWRLTSVGEVISDSASMDLQALIGRVVWDAMPELLHTPLKEVCQAVMGDGQRRTVDVGGILTGPVIAHVAPTLSGVTVRWHVPSPVMDRQAAPVGAATWHTRLLEDLEEAVSMFQYVLNDEGEVADLVWMYANASAERIFGRGREELIGSSVGQIYGGEDAFGAILSGVREARGTGRSTSFKCQYRALLGKYFHISLLPLDVRSLLVTMLDVTMLKINQLRAEEGRVRLQSIMDKIPIAVGVTDTEGKIVLDNGFLDNIWRGKGSLPHLTDYSRYRAWRPETGEPVKPEDWPSARALRGETSTEMFDIGRFDGTRGAIMISASPIHDDEGNIIGSVWANQDISNLKATEDELRRSNADLRQFAYVASHDLQEPLRMITGYLELLMRRQGDDLTPDMEEYVRVALDGAKRMKVLMDDLLTYSQIESGRADMGMVDLNEVALNTIEALRMAIDEAGASIDVGRLPKVRADAGQMHQLLQNLISNAIKFRREEPPRITISVQRRSGEWVINVGDNGIGIDPAHHDRLFNMFQRLHCRDEYEGTGIGLAICRKIVERHGGRIWVESTPMRGSTFRFTLLG